MPSTPRLEIVNFITRVASLGVLVFIALQLVGMRNEQPQPYRPLTVSDFQEVMNDPRAMKALENRLPMVRVSGNVGVSGTVDVDNVFNSVNVQAKGLDGLPVNVTNFRIPVTVQNDVRVEVTGRSSQPLPVMVENFYDMPRTNR